VGGYRILAPGTSPLSCADVKIGDRVEIDGRNTYREGKVLEKATTSRTPRTTARTSRA
jgi:ribosomal 50S subunit-recycling heat shock protein